MPTVKRGLHLAYRLLVLIGFDPRRTLHVVRGLPIYLRNLATFRRQQKASKVSFSFTKLYPCFEDRFADGGIATGHYFHQDLLVARRIYLNKPRLHVDVGSSVAGFVAHVASFRPIEVLDIRRITSKVADVKFTQCDLMGDIPKELVDYCDSLSCLHALEHFGLGRYGDPVKFDGYLAGLDNLHKILKSGGKFYFSVPIGPQRVEFDGHRVFAVKYLLDLLHEKYAIDAFSYVDDNGDLFENAALIEQNVERNFGCGFGCGIFELTKR